MNNINLLAIDMAKNVFQLHGVDERGRAQYKRRVRRGDLLTKIATMPACTIVMEACGGSHHWGRKFEEFGHKVKLISPQHVKPFVKGNKNDANDAEGIAEAASRPSMLFVPVKNIEGQNIQSIHRIRQHFIKQRTMTANHIRGLLLEYGIPIPVGINHLFKKLPFIIGDEKNELPDFMRPSFTELYESLLGLDKKVKHYDKVIDEIAKSSPVCKELLNIPGVGPKTATAVYADLSDASVYKNGRHYSANLGLVPKQHSSGEKHRLMGISKRGDSYIRQLLIHGARSVVQRVEKRHDKKSMWLKRLKSIGGTNKAAVALANKNARTIWAMVATRTAYKAELAWGA